MSKRIKIRAEERAEFEQEAADSHKVVNLVQTGPHKLKLTFDDGTTNEIDFMQGLQTVFTGALYAPFLDPDFFAQVFINRHGYLEWPRGYDFNPAHICRWRDMVSGVGAP